MKNEKLRYLSYLTVTVLGVILAIYTFMRFFFVPLLPFLIAWCAAILVRRPATAISHRLGGGRAPISAVLAVLALLVGLAAAVSVGAFALVELWHLLSSALENESFAGILAAVANPLGALFGEGEGGELGEYLGTTLKAAIGKLLDAVVGAITSFAKGVPAALIFLLVTLVATVYFAVDTDGINARITSALPKPIAQHLARIKNSFFSVGVKYVRSYLTLMLITFAVMLPGLLILGVRSAFLLALVIAFLDLLPLIGVGTVLVPWSIYNFFIGNIGVGVGLVVLLVLHEVVRQIAEPKILGKNLGIHPLLSLLLFYVGYSVFGFVGLFAVPVFSLVLACLKKNKPPEIS